MTSNHSTTILMTTATSADDDSKRKYSIGLSSLDIPYIPLSFDNASAEESALKLVQAFAPEWKEEEQDGRVVFVRFTEGITNTLFKASKNRPGRTKSEIDRDAILLRAYGRGTDVLIDRSREIKAHNALAKRGLAPELLARFDNGLMYRFVEGDVCTPQDLRKPEVFRQIAKRLGQWHAVIPISEISTTRQTNGNSSQAHDIPNPNIWTVMHQWLDALPRKTDEAKQRYDQLKQEYEHLQERFGNTPGLLQKTFVFSHCDLLSGNVIIQRSAETGNNQDEATVSFIDYEYATPGPAAFDIANHFAEWAGFDCDHAGCPTKSQRREFIQHYVTSFYTHASTKDSPSPDENDVKAAADQLYQQVDDYRGIPGFYWGIWALIQAEISQIDFNYAEYAQIRLGEYWAWKKEIDGSREKSGKEKPLRERRWSED